LVNSEIIFSHIGKFKHRFISIRSYFVVKARRLKKKVT
jgi:thermostable 8-oxoguanine DNA glycosylase